MTMAAPECSFCALPRIRDTTSKVGWRSAARKVKTRYACSCRRKGRGAGRTRHTENPFARDFHGLPTSGVFPDTKPAKPIATITQVTAQVNVNLYKKLRG